MSASFHVGAMLAERAAEQPDRLALAMPDASAPDGWRALTFAELHRLSDRYAAGFRDQGVRPGDRTLLLFRPSTDFYAVFFGLVKLGAVPVLVDAGMGLRNVLKCIAQIRPRVVVALPIVHAVRTFVRRPFAAAEVHVTAGRRWFWGGVTLQACLGPDVPFAITERAEDDDVGIVFTSGSTGTPKGVTYTHRVFAGVIRQASECLGRVAGRTCLETFAAFVLLDIAQGMTSVVPDMDLSRPATVDPSKLVEAIERFAPECAFASPVVLRRLFDHCDTHRLRLESFRDVLTGVAPIPCALHARLRDLSDGAVLHVTYGATEAITAAHTDSATILGETWEKTKQGHGSCVGVPFPETTVRIARITDDPVPTWSDEWLLPAGEIGEIVLEGPVVSPEYKDRPDANARAKIRREGAILHRSGDLGYLDDQGRLWFCGRKAHRLQTVRGMVPAVPAEGVFNEHPDVFRSALVGVGEPGAEVPVLCVELEPGHAWRPALEGEILARADGTRWAGVVQAVLPHPGFPVDARHNAKIRRGILRAWVSARFDPKQLVEAA